MRQVVLENTTRLIRKKNRCLAAFGYNMWKYATKGAEEECGDLQQCAPSRLNSRKGTGVSLFFGVFGAVQKKVFCKFGPRVRLGDFSQPAHDFTTILQDCADGGESEAFLQLVGDLV